MSPVAAPVRLTTGRGGRAVAALTTIVANGPLVARIVLGAQPPANEGVDRIASVDAAVAATAVRAATAAGTPVVLEVHAWGSDLTGGFAGTHAWGALAHAIVTASGQVPQVAIVDGPCLGGAALLLGLVDVVIATDRAVVHVSSGRGIAAATGEITDPTEFGRLDALQARAATVHLAATDLEQARDLAADLLEFLPANNADVPPRRATADPRDRACRIAATTVPRLARLGYDVRDVVRDVVDDGDLLELHRAFAPTMVVGLASVDGFSVGVVANQPASLAGAIDIAASQKAARFVRFCDAFNVPLLTFVDTPGFLPGRDQEWRGMIRHGAQLAFAYAEATVPRCSILLRKAYGGAYIVMDAKSMGNDLCVAWPGAEIAVMGAAGAVEVLHGRALATEDPCRRDELRERLLADYEATYLTPRLALEYGLVDEVIDPERTRVVLADALAAWAAKRERVPRRRHANTPL